MVGVRDGRVRKSADDALLRSEKPVPDRVGVSSLDTRHSKLVSFFFD